MMLLNTVLFVAVGSIAAAPQYYYSYYYPGITSRLVRSTYQKCPSGFIMNAVNNCVKPEIERFYFLFESPKAAVSQPHYGNQLAGNIYNGNSVAEVSPFFFVVQPEEQQRPIPGVKPFANYQTGQNQQPNSLFLQQVIPNLLPLSKQQDDSISDTSNENELSFDYSRQYQPSSGYQSLNQNLLQERRPKIDSAVTRITSFHPPSATGHSPLATGHRTDLTNTKTSNLLSYEINSNGDTFKKGESGTFDDSPSQTLAHIDGGINISPVEENPFILAGYNGVTPILPIFGTDHNSNSVSKGSSSIDTVNSIHRTVDTFQSTGDEAAELTTVTNYSNEDLESVTPVDEEIAVDLVDLRTFNDESGSTTIDQQPSSALTLIDGGVNSSPVEEEPSISTAYNGATNFFTVPGTNQQSISISKTTLKKGAVNNIHSNADIFQSPNDDIAFKPAEKLIASNEDYEQVIAVEKESTNGLLELRTFNDETSISTAGQQPFPEIAQISGGVKSSPVEEELPISNAYKNSAVNFFTVPGTKKQSNSVSRATHNNGRVNNIPRLINTVRSPIVDTAIEPLEEFITVERHSNEDDVPVIVDEAESADDSLFIRSGDEDSSNEEGEDAATGSTVPVAGITSEDEVIVKSSPVEEKLPISNAYKNSAFNFFTVPGTKKQSNSVSKATHNNGRVNNIQRPINTVRSPIVDTTIEPLEEFITVERYSNEDDVPVIVDEAESADDSLFIRSGDEDSSSEEDEDAATGSTVPDAGITSEYVEDQTAQDSVANKNTANVYFVQSEITGENPAFRASAIESQSNFNNKNTVLLGKATTEINNKFKLENVKIKGKVVELNEMFDHIKSNITSRIANSNSYKGFVYIVADEGKEIVYEF